MNNDGYATIQMCDGSDFANRVLKYIKGLDVRRASNP